MKVVVLGAGIVGLATAYQLSRKNKNIQITVLEKEPEIGKHQSGRNSGVIHSGVYYKPGSLKAQNCIQGYGGLLNFCRENQISYELCGKMIVAQNEQQIQSLNTLYERGQANGLLGLSLMSLEQVREREPHIHCLKALWVPQAGIVDYKAVMAHLKRRLIESGTEFLFNCRFLNLETYGNKMAIQHSQGDIQADFMINTCGLFSDKVAEICGLSAQVRIVPFRGEYYEIKSAKSDLIRGLVYPVPDSRFPFLGVHLTKMIGGGVHCGPNAVLALSREGYGWGDINLNDVVSMATFPGFWKLIGKYYDVGLQEVYRSLNKSVFLKSLQEMLPVLELNDLESSASGVRAQAVSRDGKLIDDFAIHELRNQVHVINAPSPAATSCLSLGDFISDKVLNSIREST